MKFRITVILVVIVLAFSMTACSKQDEAPIAQGSGTQQGTLPSGHPSTEGGQVPIVPQVSQIIVPDGVKGVWGSAIIAIEKKADNKIEDVTVALNSEYKVPDSTLKLVIGDFMPDFRMEGSTITSASSDPNNPAIQIQIFEGEEEVFSGWLYARFPAIHPFQHETYGITLKAGVKK
jgi:hypothetical protein